MILLNLEPTAYLRIFINFLLFSIIIFIVVFGISYFLFRKRERVKKIVFLSALLSFALSLFLTGFVVYKLSLLYQDLNIKVGRP